MANPEHLAILKQGVKVWNRWKESRLDDYYSYMNEDLNEEDMDGYGDEDLNEDLIDAELLEIDLGHGDFIADLSDTDLSGFDLADVNFNYTDLSGTNFTGSNLDRANLESVNLNNTNFTRAILNGVTFTASTINQTIFHQCNLVKADFGYASLENIDFSEANLNQANFDFASLENIDFRAANLTCVKFNVHCDKVNFYGVDLSTVDLSYCKHQNLNFQHTNLTGQNLSNQNLSNIDLSYANLTEVKAIGTNFENSNLTGVCIKNWIIDNKTNLKNIVCDYIYYENNQQDRRPHDPNKNFADGEFALLVQKGLETVDLIFRDGVNWTAFAYSLQKTQVINNDQDLVVQSIECKGDGVFVIRVDVTTDTNKAKIESDLRQQYEFRQNLLADQHHARIEDKDKEINRLFTLLHQAQEKIGEVSKIMAEQSKYDMRGSSFQGEFAEHNFGKMVETQHNYASQEKQSLAEAAAEIQNLLKQLEQTNPTATESEKQAFVSAAIPPTRKQRLISAVKEGGQTALQEFLDNPYLNTAMAIIRGWKNPNIDG